MSSSRPIAPSRRLRAEARCGLKHRGGDRIARPECERPDQRLRARSGSDRERSVGHRQLYAAGHPEPWSACGLPGRYGHEHRSGQPGSVCQRPAPFVQYLHLQQRDGQQPVQRRVRQPGSGVACGAEHRREFPVQRLDPHQYVHLRRHWRSAADAAAADRRGRAREHLHVRRESGGHGRGACRRKDQVGNEPLPRLGVRDVRDLRAQRQPVFQQAGGPTHAGPASVCGRRGVGWADRPQQAVLVWELPIHARPRRLELQHQLLQPGRHHERSQHHRARIRSERGEAARHNRHRSRGPVLPAKQAAQRAIPDSHPGDRKEPGDLQRGSVKIRCRAGERESHLRPQRERHHQFALLLPARPNRKPIFERPHRGLPAKVQRGQPGVFARKHNRADAAPELGAEVRLCPHACRFLYRPAVYAAGREHQPVRQHAAARDQHSQRKREQDAEHWTHVELLQHRLCAKHL